jgi:spermidine synthase
VLYFIVFITNAAILIFEITGTRLLAAYLGTSLEVWSAIIAVILASMAGGYYIGGILADRLTPRKILPIILFFSAITNFAAWQLSDVLPSFLTSHLGAVLVIQAITIATLLFAPTVALLASVTPFVTKLSLTSLDYSARVVGRLSAIGTLGSIVGALLAGSILIPNYGLDAILSGITVLLFGLGCLFQATTFFRIISLMYIFLALTTLSVQASLLPRSVIADVTTAYNRIWVSERMYHDRLSRSLATDPFVTQCQMFLNDDGQLDKTHLAFDYLRFTELLTEQIWPQDYDALFLGGCNYSLPQAMLAKQTLASAEVVELDPGMTEVAKKYFAFEPDNYPNLSVVHADARHYLRSSLKTFDFVFMDVYGSFANIPPHLTTQESFHDLAERLNQDGVLVINVIGAPDGQETDFSDALVMTVKSVLPNVSVYQFSHESLQKPQNLLLVASSSRQFQSDIAFLNETEPSLIRVPEALFSDGFVLTDNYAPIEKLTRGLRY